VVEALATGTPVVAFRRGSMPELVRHGSTGFLVEDVDDAVAAVGEIDVLRRRDCRDDVERRFTAQRMVADYAELFSRVARREPASVNR
jgi:glycosyltransferase involved in cell wall biosynthesis